MLSDVFQARVVAFDNGTPSLSATAIVNININRNLHSPIFSNSPYQIRVPETQTSGTSVTQLVVRDSDLKVGSCTTFLTNRCSCQSMFGPIDALKQSVFSTNLHLYILHLRRCKMYLTVVFVLYLSKYMEFILRERTFFFPLRTIIFSFFGTMIRKRFVHIRVGNSYTPQM